MPQAALARADFATLRSAGKDSLSLALIEARNQTLRWAAALEAAGDGRALTLAGTDADDDFDPPLWRLGHLAWQQELLVARNVRRARGEAADPSAPRLASRRIDADRCYDPALLDAPARRAAAASAQLPDLAAVRQYLVDTLETTLDLLAAVGEESDEALFFFRLALFTEAAEFERFASLAQALGIESGLAQRAPAAASRPPLGFAATRWLLGADGPGFTFVEQRPPHPIELPEFEIDAQAVSWAEFGEFVEDGGYDEPAHWSEAGRAWLVAHGRRTPRYVEQMRHGVLQHRFGALKRLPASEPVAHVTWHEAEAWCRWAGRRLPSEAEWEAAAHRGATRGFRHGDVREWTASRWQLYPGARPSPWQPPPEADAAARVQRGWSFATAPALRTRRMRAAAMASTDAGFSGFRSCAR